MKMNETKMKCRKIKIPSKQMRDDRTINDENVLMDEIADEDQPKMARRRTKRIG